MERGRIVRMCKCAVMTAIVAILSVISVPLLFTPIPLSLATFGVMLTGAILGPIDGIVVTSVYLMFGVIGLPVFSGMRAGIGVLLGPTGGFLLAYPILALGCGLFPKLIKKLKSLILHLISMTISTVLMYFVGCMWYSTYAKVSINIAFAACVTPFLLGDTFKIVLAALITIKCEKHAHE